MVLQDILPITSISFIITGFLIVLIGILWLAHTITNHTPHHNASNTDDIIGEMNEMFTYFTDQIHKREKNSKVVENTKIVENTNQDIHVLQSKYYNDVIKYKQQGKTPDQIAKQLNIGKGEVNLILGIAQMR